MVKLLDTSVDFDSGVYRNIVSLRESKNLFEDLLEGSTAEESSYAYNVEMHVKGGIPNGLNNRGFYYTTAINYPFETEPFMSSRFGNGTYGAWYGSLEFDTSIHETCFHMLREEEYLSGVKPNLQRRERAVYLVGCKAVLIDLRGKEKKFPWLISNDYGMTQAIGSRLQNEGHPGLIAPSARTAGSNVVAFTPSILSKPRSYCFLTYTLVNADQKVIVERQPGEIILEVKKRQSYHA
jgi:hypothetical protein